MFEEIREEGVEEEVVEEKKLKLCWVMDGPLSKTNIFKRVPSTQLAFHLLKQKGFEAAIGGSYDLIRTGIKPAMAMIGCYQEAANLFIIESCHVSTGFSEILESVNCLRITDGFAEIIVVELIKDDEDEDEDFVGKICGAILVKESELIDNINDIIDQVKNPEVCQRPDLGI